jgi:hypothetical protein
VNVKTGYLDVGGLSLDIGCCAEVYTSYELGIFGYIFIS